MVKFFAKKKEFPRLLIMVLFFSERMRAREREREREREGEREREMFYLFWSKQLSLWH